MLRTRVASSGLPPAGRASPPEARQADSGGAQHRARFERTIFDAAIFALDSLPSGYVAEKLANEEMIIVASPNWLRQHRVSST